MSTAGTINEALTRISAGGGKLRYVSATALSFKPYMGSTIKINGALYEIPATGMVGLANTGVYVNGVAGQTLVANTLYYVYAFMNGAVLTADFSTTGHGTSTAAANVGTEIKTGDETRSLVGMVMMGGGAGSFYSEIRYRYVISWFNRGDISLLGNHVSMQQASVMSPYDLVNNTIAFCTWGDEAVNLNVNGWMANNSVSYCHLTARWDGTTWMASIQNYDLHNIVNYLMTEGQAEANTLSEGYHTFTPTVWVGGGLGDFYMWVGAMIRG